MLHYEIAEDREEDSKDKKDSKAKEEAKIVESKWYDDEQMILKKLLKC